MLTITLRQLQYFDALARIGHFGRAAEACFVSQPALTVQIQELENQLGARLVERGRRGAVLTETGQRVAERTRKLLLEAEDLVQSAQANTAPLTGRLRLGIIPTVAPYLLPTLLPFLRQTYPDLELHVRETQTAILLDEVESARIDVMLAALPIAHPDLESLALFEDRFVLAAPRHHEAEGRVELSEDWLRREPLLLLEEGHCFRDQAIRYCALRQVGGYNTLGASSFATIMRMVANGLGMTLLPEIAVIAEARSEDIRILRLEEPEPSRVLGLLWRRESPRRADIHALAEAISIAQQALAGWSRAP
ncbi:MAG TPA: LysR substrate-binding domain-containing protein [Rhabdaerophilum sp.]|nr:LysR substrate-binding domain-containing protein [Rhabdaerophilum sp.]